jgi:hypothetical protein
MAEWRLLTTTDQGNRWVNLDRIAYIVEVNDAIVLGTYTELHFDRDLSLRVKEPASQITRRHVK